MDRFKNTKRYMILLYCNKKLKRVYHNTMRKCDITEKWNELKTQVKPPYIRLENNRGKERIYELVLIYPADKRSKPVYSRDSLGRTKEAKINSVKHRIREVIPYWVEETIYDYETKKQLRYYQLIDILKNVTEISQIFKLNNKIVLQIDDYFRVFGNKNVNDCDRLFDLIREDLLNQGHGNFLFVKDIVTDQRRRLYELLMSKGFSKQILYRHYSY